MSIHYIQISIQCQSSANPFQSDAYQTSIRCNQVPTDPNLTPIWHQSDTNPMTIQCTSPATIQCQSRVFPFQSHQVPVHRQTCANLMSILCQWIAHLLPTHSVAMWCQSITDPPIQCQSCTNPLIHRFNKLINMIPISCQSHASTIKKWTDTGSARIGTNRANPIPIGGQFRK